MTKKPKEPELDGFAPGARPLCVFCNAPWSDLMVGLYTHASILSGYYEGDYELEGVTACAVIEINCESCGRAIYRKEIVQPTSGYDDI